MCVCVWGGLRVGGRGESAGWLSRRVCAHNRRRRRRSGGGRRWRRRDRGRGGRARGEVQGGGGQPAGGAQRPQDRRRRRRRRLLARSSSARTASFAQTNRQLVRVERSGPVVLVGRRVRPAGLVWSGDRQRCQAGRARSIAAILLIGMTLVWSPVFRLPFLFFGLAAAALFSWPSVQWQRWFDVAEVATELWWHILVPSS